MNNEQGQKTVWSAERHVAHYDVPDQALSLLDNDQTVFYLSRLIASELPSQGSLLDIGCAVGALYALLKSRGAELRYTGLDITPEFVARAAEKYPDARFECGSALSLPFADRSFDLVVSKGTLFVLDDHRKAIAEALRVCCGTAILDLVLRPQHRENLAVKTIDRGQITLLGSDGVAEILQSLKAYRVNEDMLSIGLLNRKDLHPAYEKLSYLKHLVLTVKKEQG